MDEATAATVVEVLRHAKACSREAWDAGDDSRPLDDAGWTQATQLSRDLNSTPLAGIYCSPAVRCTQTVEMLAAVTGRTVAIDERLAGVRTVPVTENGKPWPTVAWLGSRALSLLDDAVSRHRGGRIVLCSHGDVLAALLAVLAGREGLDLGDVGLKKGARIRLTFDADRRVRSHSRVPAPPHRIGWPEPAPRTLNGAPCPAGAEADGVRAHRPGPPPPP